MATALQAFRIVCRGMLSKYVYCTLYDCTYKNARDVSVKVEMILNKDLNVRVLYAVCKKKTVRKSLRISVLKLKVNNFFSVKVSKANSISSNVCQGGNFENYCSIKRMLWLREWYVWGLFAMIDSSLRL